MAEIVYAVLAMAVISSFIVYGLTKTVMKAFNLKKIPNAVALGMVYLAGVASSFAYWNDFSLWKVVVNGIIVGCVAVGLYESAVKALLSVIPSAIERILGGSKGEPL